LVENFSDENLNLRLVEPLVMVLVILVIETSEQQPEQTAQPTDVILGRLRWSGQNFLALEDELLHELEVLDVGHQAVGALDGVFEEGADLSRIHLDPQKVIGVVQQLDKLLSGELPLSSVFDPSFFVASLKGQLTTMTF
jgi:hypothetical protein